MVECEDDRKRGQEVTREDPLLLSARVNYFDNGATLGLWQTEELQRAKAHLASALFALQVSQSRLHPREWQPTVTHVESKQEQLSMGRASVPARHYL